MADGRDKLPASARFGQSQAPPRQRPGETSRQRPPRPVSSTLAAAGLPSKLSIHTSNLHAQQGYSGAPGLPPIHGTPDAMAGAEGISGPSVNLLIMNLPFRVRWQDLKDLCRQACDIERADVALELDGRSRGFGEIVVGSRQDAQKLFQMFDGFEWMNRKLSVIVMDPTAGGMQGVIQSPIQAATRTDMSSLHSMMAGMSFAQQSPASLGFGMQPPSPNERAVFVGNLPFHVQWQDLKDLLQPAGRIARVEISSSRDGRSRGWGTVLFETEQEADMAVQLFDRTEVGGRVIKVRKDRLSAGGAANVAMPFPGAAAGISSFAAQADTISRSMGVTPVPKPVFGAPPRSSSMSMMQPPTPTSPMMFAPRRAHTAEQQRQQQSGVEGMGQGAGLPGLSRLSQGFVPQQPSAVNWEHNAPWQGDAGYATRTPNYARPIHYAAQGQQQPQQPQQGTQAQPPRSAVGDGSRHKRKPSNSVAEIWER